MARNKETKFMVLHILCFACLAMGVLCLLTNCVYLRQIKGCEDLRLSPVRINKVAFSV